MPEYGKLMNENKKSYRNQSNIWIIDSIKDVNNRKKFDKTNKNNVLFFNLLIFVKIHIIQEFLLLFRLLAIKYRAKYPLKGKTIDVDNDLQIYLGNKICNSFLKYISIFCR